MRKALMLLALAAVAWSPSRTPRTVTLTWDAPDGNVDGTPITNLSHYVVYQQVLFGTNVLYNPLRTVPATVPAPVGLGTQSTVFSNLTAASYTWLVTAVNLDGDESEMSVPVTVEFRVPKPPRNVRGERAR